MEGKTNWEISSFFFFQFRKKVLSIIWNGLLTKRKLSTAANSWKKQYSTLLIHLQKRKTFIMKWRLLSKKVIAFELIRISKILNDQYLFQVICIYQLYQIRYQVHCLYLRPYQNYLYEVNFRHMKSEDNRLIRLCLWTKEFLRNPQCLRQVKKFNKEF